MTRFVQIALLAAVVIPLGWRVADLERQRYAMLVGICERDPRNLTAWSDCVVRAEPRTSAWWNLYYGLKG